MATVKVGKPSNNGCGLLGFIFYIFNFFIIYFYYWHWCMVADDVNEIFLMALAKVIGGGGLWGWFEFILFYFRKLI